MRQQSLGFTIIELLAVLVIISVLSLVLIPRWSPVDQTLSAQSARLSQLLRHAQTMAMTQGKTIRLALYSPSRYAVVDDDSIVRSSDGTELAVDLLNQVTISGDEVRFDSLGRPVRHGKLFPSIQTLILNGDNLSTSIRILPVTGYVDSGS